MSQESDCTTCSQLSISQGTMDLIWKSMEDLTNASSYTQIASRDPVLSSDNVLSVDNGDVLIDKFKIAKSCTAEDNIHLDQLKKSSSDLLETPHSNHKEINPSNSCSILQSVDTMLQLPVFSSNVQFAGALNFQMLLSAQSKETKAVDWTYSELLHKVYVRFGQSCPFYFRADVNPPPGTILRAMPIYSRPQNAHEVAKRCPHHSRKSAPDNLGVSVPPTHLIRCDHKAARYEEDSVSGFQSVVVPYEHLTACDEKWSIYLYQFMCFSSCIGGLNRRPVQVVFSLESAAGITLGRQAIEVRICACPGRDRHSDEKNATPQSSLCAEPSQRTSVASEVTTVCPPAKRRRVEENEVFNIPVLRRENYEILLRIRDSLEVSSTMPRSQFERLKERHEEIRKSQSTVQSSAGVDLTKPSNQFPSSVILANIKSEIPETVIDQSSIGVDLTKSSNQYPSSVFSSDSKSRIQETDVDHWLSNNGLSACSFAFRCRELFTVDQLYSLSLEGFEKLGLSEEQLASVWLAVSRDHRLRKVDSTSYGFVNDTCLNPVHSSNNIIDPLVVSDQQKERLAGDMFEVTRYTFKRRLSLPKEKDCS